MNVIKSVAAAIIKLFWLLMHFALSQADSFVESTDYGQSVHQLFRRMLTEILKCKIQCVAYFEIQDQS